MSFPRVHFLTTVLAGACVLFSGRASATTITTTSTTTWKSSSYITGAYSVLDFYPVLQPSYNTAAGITLTPSGSTTGVNFTGLDNGAYYLAGDTTQKTLMSSTDAGAFIKLAMPSTGENAFLLGTGATASHPLTLTFSDGESFSINTGVFGVSVSHQISWLTLAGASGSQAMVSDFWFAASSLAQDSPGGSTPVPTPEPATVLMTLAGAAFLLAGSKKWKAEIEQIS